MESIHKCYLAKKFLGDSGIREFKILSYIEKKIFSYDLVKSSNEYWEHLSSYEKEQVLKLFQDALDGDLNKDSLTSIKLVEGGTLILDSQERRVSFCILNSKLNDFEKRKIFQFVINHACLKDMDIFTKAFDNEMKQFNKETKQMRRALSPENIRRKIRGGIFPSDD